MYTIIGGDGKQYGPISESDLRKWITEGRLNAQSLAKAESDAEFRTLATFPELAELFGIAPPASGVAPVLGSGDDGAREAAARRIKVPAIGLIVVAILGMLLDILDLFLPSTKLMQSFLAGMQQQNDNPQLNDLMAKMQNAGHSAFAIGNDFFQIIIEILILVGALKMLKLRGYNFAYAAAIMSVIPCITSCCIWPLGLIFGIWAMVVMSKPEVKSQFS
jgi:GYF domain 2